MNDGLFYADNFLLCYVVILPMFMIKLCKYKCQSYSKVDLFGWLDTLCFSFSFQVFSIAYIDRASNLIVLQSTVE